MDCGEERKKGRKEGRKGENDRWRWLRSDGNLVGEERTMGMAAGKSVGQRSGKK